MAPDRSPAVQEGSWSGRKWGVVYRTVRDDGVDDLGDVVQTYYDVLGVDPDADLEAIRQAWRVKVRLLHPDRHHGSPDDVQAEAATETLRVNRAWATLRDPERRREYDFSIGATRAHDDAGRNTTREQQRRGHNTTREHGTATKQAPNRVEVTSAICHTTQQVPRNAGRFVCGNCHMAWQFAKCEACNKITHVRERKTRWRCPSCEHEQTSSWGGGTKYVHCMRCKTGNLTSPEVARFNCSQCRLAHIKCDCGQYSPVIGSQWRSWRCPKCRRLNPPARRSSFDLAQVATLVLIAFLGLIGLYLMTGLVR